VIELLEQSACGREEQLAEALSRLLLLRFVYGPDYGLRGEELRAFKKRVADGVQSGNNPVNLENYLGEAASWAAEGRYDGYAPAVLARSSFQILLEDFGEWDLMNEQRREDLAYIDEDLREAAEDAPPVETRFVPPNLPATHWWWKAPKRTDMSERERRLRLRGRDLYMIETYGI